VAFLVQRCVCPDFHAFLDGVLDVSGRHRVIEILDGPDIHGSPAGSRAVVEEFGVGGATSMLSMPALCMFRDHRCSGSVSSGALKISSAVQL